jgi:hypothetical protein
MQKTAAKRKDAGSASDRQYKTTGFHLPKNLWELLNRVAVEMAWTKSGWASGSASPVELIERHKREPKKELA